MGFRSALIAQFRRPRGLLGRLAGRIMFARASNRQRNDWALDLLGLTPEARVLEIGSGPGYAAGRLLARFPSASYVGIDHSDLMVRQAAGRLRAAVSAGKARFVAGPVETADLPGPFDTAFSCNVLQFVADRRAVLRRLGAAVKPGGRIVTVFQPRSGKVSRDAGEAWAKSCADDCRAAGLTDLRIEELPLEPVPAFAVVAHAPPPR